MEGDGRGLPAGVDHHMNKITDWSCGGPQRTGARRGCSEGGLWE